MKQLQNEMRNTLSKFFNLDLDTENQLIDKMIDPFIEFGKRVRSDQHKKSKDLFVEAIKDAAPSVNIHNKVLASINKVKVSRGVKRP